MRGVALHNALLMHQHSMHRMDATPSSLQPQQPPPGFYANLMVSTPALHTLSPSTCLYAFRGCCGGCLHEHFGLIKDSWVLELGTKEQQAFLFGRVPQVPLPHCPCDLICLACLAWIHGGRFHICPQNCPVGLAQQLRLTWWVLAGSCHSDIAHHSSGAFLCGC